MKKRFLSVLIAALVLGIGFVWGSAVISVKSMPPVVVKTFPRAGDTAVDPGIKEIRVTFSKDMMTHEMWSWVMASKDSFPEITGEVRYVDKRTCVAPVRLKPGRTYGIWFNSQKHNSFRDTAGQCHRESRIRHDKDLRLHAIWPMASSDTIEN